MRAVFPARLESEWINECLRNLASISGFHLTWKRQRIGLLYCSAKFNMLNIKPVWKANSKNQKKPDWKTDSQYSQREQNTDKTLVVLLQSSVLVKNPHYNILVRNWILKVLCSLIHLKHSNTLWRNLVHNQQLIWITSTFFFPLSITGSIFRLVIFLQQERQKLLDA